MTGPAPTPAPARRWRRWAVAIAFVTVVLLVGGVLAARLDGGSSTRSVLVGRSAPPLVGDTLDGDRFDLSEWRGSVVLVNLWASWCEPCRREQPLLSSAEAALGGRGLRIVGVSVRDDPDAARDFLAEFGGENWPTIADPDGVQAVEWGTFGLPETYLVGRDGTIVAKAIGEVDAAWIDEHVVPLLDEEAS